MEENEYKTKTIAVVGVSFNEEKYGYKIFRDLVNNNYNVYGINIKGGVLFNRKIYTSLKELIAQTGKKPDLVIVVTPPNVSIQILEQCKELGIGKVWFQPGAESEEVIQKAKNYGINAVFNACFMVKNNIWKEEMKPKI